MSRGRTSALVVREALLRAARELLDERGPTGLAIRDIAARAGVAPMGVYNRFGSKDGILNALLEQGFAELAAVVTVRPDAADPLGAITTGMGNYRAFALANPAMYRLMFDQPNAGFEPSPEARMMALATFERLIDAVQLGIATGHLRPGAPEEIAQRIWAACHGATSLELRGIAFISDHDAHYAALVRTLLRGLAAHPAPEGES
ncbi:putative HTH-type transcriptional regulator [Actinomadura sp. RB68]|uniref:Putative HTH-type transcriptional regulator n=2 Tax=Actinomadura macrotermitis TaxID=2585200 RepID=A0A7K0BRI9_9ACTN|nr:putative HTH-type transcriptional regulator [Actinomadura macrotermitis]